MNAYRIAIVHDWLTGMRGGEHVLEAMAELFPRAELFTLIYVPGRISPVLTALKRHTSILQRVPAIEKRYRSFLPVMPFCIERFDLKGFDLVISSSHCVAKGIRKPTDALHISYVHAPMRYMWDRYDDYFAPGHASLPVRIVAKLIRHRLQNWDRLVSGKDRVDKLIANSKFIAGQIERAYGRRAEVIYPFVDFERFAKRQRHPGRYYLMVGAMAPYKRIDIAIEAFNKMRLPLIIVGSGQNEEKLQKNAGPTVEFLGNLSDEAVADLYSKCKAFIFPGVEDFGIAPLEAMAAGAPVIAYAQGGLLETVTDKTGIFFDRQTADGLIEAVSKYEEGKIVFSHEEIRDRARLFSRERFQRELVETIKKMIIEVGKDPTLFLETVSSGWSFLAKSSVKSRSFS
ncbi:MAG: glycosyltransferase [Bdellovibrionota bacterium]